MVSFEGLDRSTTSFRGRERGREGRKRVELSFDFDEDLPCFRNLGARCFCLLVRREGRMRVRFSIQS